MITRANSSKKTNTILFAAIFLAVILCIVLFGTEIVEGVAYAESASVAVSELGLTSGIDAGTDGAYTYTATTGTSNSKFANGRDAGGNITFSYSDGFLGVGSANGAIGYGYFMLNVTSGSNLATAVASGSTAIEFSVSSIYGSGTSCLVGYKTGAGSVSVDSLNPSAGFITSSLTSPGSGALNATSASVSGTLPSDTTAIAILVMAADTTDDSSSANFSGFSVTFTATDGGAPKITALNMTELVTGNADHPCATAYETSLETGRAIDTLSIDYTLTGNSTFNFPSWRKESKTISSLTVTDLKSQSATNVLGLVTLSVGNTTFNLMDSSFIGTTDAITVTDDEGLSVGTVTYVSHTTDSTSGTPVVSSITIKLVFTANVILPVGCADAGQLARTEMLHIGGIDNSTPGVFTPVTSETDESFPVVGPIEYDTGTGTFNYGSYINLENLTNRYINLNWVTSSLYYLDFDLVENEGDVSPCIYYYAFSYSSSPDFGAISSTQQGVGIIPDTESNYLAWKSTLNNSLNLRPNFQVNGPGYYKLALYTLNYAGTLTATQYYFFKVDYSSPVFSVSSIADCQDDGTGTYNPKTPVAYNPSTWTGNWTSYAVQITLSFAAQDFSQNVITSGACLPRSSGVKFYYHLGDEDLIEIGEAGRPCNGSVDSALNYENYYVVEGTGNYFYLKLCFDAIGGTSVYEEFDADIYFVAINGAGVEYAFSYGVPIRIDRNAPETPSTDSFDNYIYDTSNKIWYTDESIELDFSTFADEHLEEIKFEVSASYYDSNGVMQSIFKKMTFTGETLIASNMLYDLLLTTDGFGISSPNAYYFTIQTIDQAANKSGTSTYIMLVDTRTYYVEYYIDTVIGNRLGGFAEFSSEYVAESYTEEITRTDRNLTYDVTVYQVAVKRGSVVGISVSTDADYLFCRYDIWATRIDVAGIGEYDFEITVETANIRASVFDTTAYKKKVENPYDDPGVIGDEYIYESTYTARYGFFFKREIDVAVSNATNNYAGAPINANVVFSSDLDGEYVSTVTYYDGNMHVINYVPQNVGNYYVGVSIESDAYICESATSAFIIRAVALTVTAIGNTLENPYYYNTLDPELNYTVSGLVGADIESFSDGTLASGSLSIGDCNVGTHTISIDTLNFGSNYTVRYVGATFTILPYQANIEIFSYDVDNFSKNGTYTGSAHTIRYSGNNYMDYTVSIPKNSENTDFAYCDIRLYFCVDGVDAGEYDIELASVEGLYGCDTDNFEFTLIKPASFTYTIKQATLTIVPASASKVYHAANPVISYTVAGWKGSDSETMIVSGSFVSAGSEDVGEYAIVVGDAFVLTKDNYKITTNTSAARFTVSERSVKVYPYSNQTKIAGTALTSDNAIEFYFTGDDSASADSVFTGALSYDGYELYVSETAGTVVSISLGTLAATSNYTIDYFESATMTLVAAPQTPATPYISFGEEFRLESVFGIGAVDFAVTQEELYDLHGTYWTLENIGNYTFAQIYPTADDFSYSIESDISESTVPGIYGGAWRIVLDVPANYQAIFGETITTAFDIMVNPAVVEVVFAKYSFTYGDAIGNLMDNYNVRVRSDSDGVLAAKFAGEYPYYKITADLNSISNLSVGAYPVSMTNIKVFVRSGEGNTATYSEYTGSGIIVVPSSTSYFTIEKKTVTVSFSAQQLSKEYGDADNGIAYSVDGLLNDGATVSGSVVRVLNANGMVTVSARYDCVSALLPEGYFYGIRITKEFSAGSNYNVVLDFGDYSSVHSVVYTIYPKKVILSESSFNIVNKVYDSSSDVIYPSTNPLIAYSFAVRAADSVSYSYQAVYGTGTGESFVESATPGSRTIRISSLALASTGDSLNYKFVATNGDPITSDSVFYLTGATISKLEFTIVQENFLIAEKQYDGTQEGELAGTVNLPGFFDESDITYSVLFNEATVSETALVDIVCTVWTSNASQYMTYNHTSDAVTLTFYSDRIVIEVNDILSKITRRVISVDENGAIITANDKIFDGTTTASFSYTFAEGALVAGETVELTIIGSFNELNAGDTFARITSMSVKEKGGTQYANYTVGDYSTLTFDAEILKARLAVDMTVNEKVYDATSAITSTVNGLSLTVNVNGASVNVNSLPYVYVRKGATLTVTESDYSATQLFQANINNFSLTYGAYLVKLSEQLAVEYPNVVIKNGEVALHDVLFVDMLLKSSDSTGYVNNFEPVFYVGGALLPLGSVSYKAKTATAASNKSNAVYVPSFAEVVRKKVSIDLANVVIGSKIYDGTLSASLSDTSGIKGFCAGDDVSLSYSITLKSANVADNVTASFKVTSGVNGNGILGASFQSYVLENAISKYTKTQSIAITRRQISIASITVPGKTYDGTNSVTGGIGAVVVNFERAVAGGTTGLLDADVGNITLNMVGVSFETSNVVLTGNYALIYVSADIASQLSGGAGVTIMNYELTGLLSVENDTTRKYVRTTAPATIAPKKVSPTITIAPKIYDGTDECFASQISISVTENGVSYYAKLAELEVVASYNSASAGTNKSAVLKVQNGLWNSATDELVTNFTIGTAVENENYIEVRATGLVIEKMSIFAYAADKTVTYGTVVANASVNKYYATERNGSLVWLTLETVGTERWWTLETSSEQLLKFDGRESDLPSLTSTFASTTAVGSYAIEMNAGGSTNFSFTVISGSVSIEGVSRTTGSLTVTKAPVTVYTTNYARGYKGDNPQITLLFSGFKNNQIPGVNVTGMIYPVAKFGVVRESNGGFVEEIISNSVHNVGTSMTLDDDETGLYVVYIDISNAVSDCYSFQLADEYAVFTIQKAYVDGLSMSDRSFVFDGQSKSISVTGTNSLINNNKLVYKYYKSADGSASNFEATPIAGATSVINAGVYKVVASYDEDDNFSDWSDEAVLTVSQKALAITVSEYKTEWTGNSIKLSAPVISNVSELTAFEYEALVNRLTINYYTSGGERLSGVPYAAGTYSYTAVYTAETGDNYKTSSSKSVKIVISPVNVTLVVNQKSFVYTGSRINVLYTASYTSQYITNTSFIRLTYKDASGAAASPVDPGTYTFTFSSSDESIQIVGDINGLMFIGLDTLSDGNEEEGITSKITISPASDSTVIPSNSYAQYSLVTVKSTSTGKEETTTNKTARYIWNAAQTNLAGMNISSIVQCVMIDNDTFNETQPSGSVEMTIKIPSAVPSDFRMYVQLADGTFKEIAYTKSGSYVTFITDTTGYFVFAYEDTLPLELIIGLSIAGFVVLIALVVGIVLAKKYKRLRLVEKYVNTNIDARDYRVKRAGQLINGETRVSVVRDYDGDPDLHYDEETGEYFYDDVEGDEENEE